MTAFAAPSAPVPGAPSVDVRAARLAQGAVAALVAIAAALGDWRLLAIPAAHLALAAALGRRGNAVVRAFDAWLAPRLGPGEREDARPPRFANLVGAVFLAAAVLAHAARAPILGWALALVVGGLALLAATTGACVGCWAYGYLGPFRGLLRRLG